MIVYNEFFFKEMSYRGIAIVVGAGSGTAKSPKTFTYIPRYKGFEIYLYIYAFFLVLPW